MQGDGHGVAERLVPQARVTAAARGASRRRPTLASSPASIGHRTTQSAGSAAKREVIRAAYVSLAKEHHPDAGGAAERMVALNEAWAVLGDVKRRAAYDQARRATSAPPPAQAARWDPRDSGDRAYPAARRGRHWLLHHQGLRETLGLDARGACPRGPHELKWLPACPSSRQSPTEIYPYHRRARRRRPSQAQPLSLRFAGRCQGLRQPAWATRRGTADWLSPAGPAA